MANVIVLDDPPERWAPVKGLEGYYEVSTLGRVRSLDRIVHKSDGKGQPFKGKMISNRKRSPLGYVGPLALSRPGRKTRHIHAHVLVAEAFLKKPSAKVTWFVCHKDDIKHHNWLSNLYWGTRSDNAKDALANGCVKKIVTRKNGKKHHSVTPPKTIRKIRRLRAEGYNFYEIGEACGVSHFTAFQYASPKGRHYKASADTPWQKS
jgi:hypothetical protein